MQGQTPVNDKCYCEKCRKTMNATQKFFTYRDGSKTKMCKQCLTLHIDNFKPDTFLWLLEEFDIPYIPHEWNKIRDEAFAKNPRKMNGMSVFGKYLTKMKLSQFMQYRWADTEMLKAAAEAEAASMGLPRRGSAEEREVWESQVAALKEQLEKGEISKAQYDTLMPAEIISEEMLPTSTEEAYVAAGIDMTEDANPEVDSSVAAVSSNMYDETQFIDEKDLPDPGAQLTEDDKLYLAVKWGRLYTPNQWISLEQNYDDMMDSFDIQDADTKNALILICKTNLKMNEAIDAGDFEGYKKLTTVYEALRKSAKFTAAQNKNDKGDYVDSIGELVAMCEREGGFIPRFVTNIPQDKVDFTLQDMNKYVYNLVTKDLGFGQQIENYIKKIELEREAQAEMDASEDNLSIDVTDSDIQDYYDDLDDQRDTDNDVSVDTVVPPIRIIRVKEE